MSDLSILKTKDINNITELFDIHNDFMKMKKVGWIFRGQKKEKKNEPLKTSLEKALNSFKINKKEAPIIEKGLVRKFKRHSKVYLKNIPDSYQYMEWFALMQHYRAPTRLQDWTYSFFDAVYMAINDMEDNAEVWAINTNYIEEKAKEIIKRKNNIKNTSYKEDIDDIVKNDACVNIPGLFEKIFMDDLKAFVLPMNPHNLNERLIIQQGIFLCPGDIRKSFYHNLSSNFSLNDVNDDNIRRYRFLDDAKKKKEILQHLQRMNMNNAVLFPGLSGFAESLRTWLAFFPEQPNVLAGDTDYVKKDYLSRMDKCRFVNKTNKKK